MYLKYTGTLDSACTITIAPNTMKRMQFIENGTSGSQNIIISQGSGANITIPPGDTKAVYLDGAGSGAAVVDAFASLNVVDLKVQDDLTVTDDVIIVNGDIDLEGSIDVNGTANLDVVDIDGAVDMASTLQVDGVATFTGRDIHSGGITIANAGQIGSVGDTDAIAIASDGVVTLTQKLVGTELDISGNIDVDGTANLDVVDVDGAANFAADVTLGGDILAADFDVNASGDINLDAGGGDWRLIDDGTTICTISNVSGDLQLLLGTQDKDFKFQGDDGGVQITALQLDMSNGGRANFNNDIGLNDDRGLRLGSGDDSVIYNDGSNLYIKNATSNQDIIFQGNDDGSSNTTALTLDMSDAGAATFNGNVTVPNLLVADDITHSGDADTYISFEADARTDYVGGTRLVDLAPGIIIFNEGGGDVDFRVETNNQANAFIVEGATDDVLFGCGGLPSGLNGGAAFETTQSSGRTILQLGTTSGSALRLANFYNNSGNVGNITVSGSATAFNTSSDARLKENIVDSPSASSDIDAIQVRSFDWKFDGANQKYGMIAQELLEVAPEAVFEGEKEEDMMSIDYSKLVPMLVKEIQSLRTRITALES